MGTADCSNGRNEPGRGGLELASDASKMNTRPAPIGHAAATRCPAWISLGQPAWASLGVHTEGSAFKR